MKKVILFLLFVAVNSIAVYSQTSVRYVQKMEVELRAGLTTPLGDYHTGKSQTSASLGLEGRYNF